MDLWEGVNSMSRDQSVSQKPEEFTTGMAIEKIISTLRRIKPEEREAVLVAVGMSLDDRGDIKDMVPAPEVVPN